MAAETEHGGGRKSLRAILVDCAIAAFITFVIAAPIMGLRTINAPGGMRLEQHWGKVGLAVAIVFFGRLALQLFVWNKPEGSGVGTWPLRLALSALIGWVVGAVVCYLALGGGAVTMAQAMSNALLVSPWNLASLLFAVAAFSLSYGFASGGARRARRDAVAGPDIDALGDLLKIGLLMVAIALPFLPWSDRYIIDLAILILTYIMLGWGLNIVVGLAGLLDLGYVAFYAVGAYSYALLSTIYFPQWFPEWLMPYAFWIALPLAGTLAALWGVALGFPVLRLRGDYLAIVTLAFGEIIRVVLINWYDFTGGPNGISGIPRPTFFGIPFESGENGFAAWIGIPYAPIQRIIFLYYIILSLALITNVVTLRLRKLPLGRAWEALREDEIACRSLGINTTSTKLTAFAMGAMFGGFAGSFFATRQGFVSPESFVFMESALILAIVVLGGLGSQIGVVIASIVMIGGFEAFRNLDFLKNIFGPEFDPAQYRMIVFGLAMVAIMIWRPRGLVTHREPSIYLKEKKTVSGELVAEGRG